MIPTDAALSEAGVPPVHWTTTRQTLITGGARFERSIGGGQWQPVTVDMAGTTNWDTVREVE